MRSSLKLWSPHPVGVDSVVMDGLTGTDREQGWEHPNGLSWFISPHGFGHAARASSVIAAVSRLCAGIGHHIFTTVPKTFFDDSLEGVSFVYHSLECDIGMVQRTPLVEDVEGTTRALHRLPLDGGRVFERIVGEVAATRSRLVISDIAPLGLAVANRLSLPGILIENFTWDWIYRAYDDPLLGVFGDRMGEIFDSAALRIQTVPVCRPVFGAHTVPPVSRRRRLEPDEVRESLGIPADHRVVLMSIGGLEGALGAGFRPPPATTLVAPGDGDRIDADGDLIWIPAMGGPYHPDLVAASDLVVAKLGYSTVAEVYHAGTAFAYLRRPTFPESPILEAFVEEHIQSAPLPDDWLDDPATARVIEDLLGAPRPGKSRINGAKEAAELILNPPGLQF
jgi:hypothetical protein